MLSRVHIARRIPLAIRIRLCVGRGHGVAGAAAAQMSMTPDFFARATWTGLNNSAATALYQTYLDSWPGAKNCRKVSTTFFYYKSLGRSIRGAQARERIAKGEVFCQMPVQHLVSWFMVANSSLGTPLESIITKSLQAPSSSDMQAQQAGMAVFVLRESARERSTMMPYLQTMQMHDVSGVPMLWPDGAPQWKSVSPMQIELGRTAKANQQKQYDTVMRPMLMHHRAVLSEGLGCGLVGCSAHRLDHGIYSPAEFARVLAIISARDWVLPMYGNERPFMAPVLDMLNFGQVRARPHAAARSSPTSRHGATPLLLASICALPHALSYTCSLSHARTRPYTHAYAHISSRHLVRWAFGPILARRRAPLSRRPRSRLRPGQSFSFGMATCATRGGSTVSLRSPTQPSHPITPSPPCPLCGLSGAHSDHHQLHEQLTAWCGRVTHAYATHAYICDPSMCDPCVRLMHM